MHGFTPDQIGAIVGGFLVMMSALVAVVVKAWQALSDIRGEVKHNHGGSMKDTSARTEEKVDELLRTQRGMARDIGRLADADQRIEDTAHDEHERLWKALDRLSPAPPVTGWDHGDHVTSQRPREDS